MDYKLRLLELLKQQEFPDKVAVAFSGGIDSSVVAFFASKKASVNLYTAGVPGCHDFASAEHSAKLLRLNLREIEVEGSIKEHIDTLSNIVGVNDNFVLSYLLPVYFVAGSCEEEAIVLGAGADELFGGYAKYLRIENKEEEMKKDYDRLVKNSFEVKIAKYFRKKLIMPFLNKEIIEFAFSLPLNLKINNGIRKYILREVARMVIPEEIVEKPKKAAQYGSGLLKKINKLITTP